MRNIYYSVTARIATGAALLLPAAASAQGFEPGLGSATKNLGSASGELSKSSTPLPELIGNFINIFLGVLGVIFVILVIYAGWMRLSSQGDPAKVEKSNKMLIQAVIGIVIIVAAYGISSFVIDSIITAAT